MSHTEIYNLPVRYRNWYIDRLVKHFKDRNDASRKNDQKSKNTYENQKGFDQFQEMINNKFD